MRISNILAKFFSPKNLTSKSSDLPFSDFSSGWQSLTGLKPYETIPTKDALGLIESYKGWVYVAVSKIAENFASNEWYLESKTSDKEVTSSKILDIFLDPNDDYSFTEILELTQIHLLLTGDAFWYLPVTKLNFTKIIILRPDLVIKNYDSKRLLTSYTYQGQTMSVEEVIQFRVGNPMMSGRGFAPLKAGESSQNIWEFIQKWNSEFFYNSAMVNGVIEGDRIMDFDTAKQIKDKWNENFRGISQSNQTAVLPFGIKYHPIGTNPRDADFMNADAMARDFILSLYGLPKAIVGMTTDYNKANIEGAEYIYAKHTIEPILRKFADQLNKKFIPRFDKNVKFEFESPIPEDKLKKAEVLEKMKWFITPNEARAEMELDPIEGGDEISKETPKNQSPDQKSEDSKKKVENSISTIYLRGEEAKKSSKNPPTEQEIENLIQTKENILAQKMSNWFGMVEKKLFGKIEKSLITKATEDFIDPAIFLDLSEILQETFKKYSFQTSKDFWKIQDEYFQETLKFDEDNIRVAVEMSANKFANQVSTSVLSELNNIFMRVIKEGASPQKAMSELKKQFPDFAKSRIKTIAQTEVSSIHNKIAVERYKFAGIEKYRWKHRTATGKERQSHVALNGKIINLAIGEKVMGEVGLLRYPHDPEALAGDVVNCRCRIEPVFEE